MCARLVEMRAMAGKNSPKMHRAETTIWSQTLTTPEHRQLNMEPGCAPQRIYSAHPLDEITQDTIDLWPPYPILVICNARTH